MTSFSVTTVPFAGGDVHRLGLVDRRFSNWPVVYTLNGRTQIYVGETLSATGRLRQHLASTAKQSLDEARVILGETFNKSACLDLESYLIRLFAGEGRFEVLNGNAGITDRNYYDRDSYQTVFAEIFEKLRQDGPFQSSIKDIENGDLFKLSPFKALTEDQTVAVIDILEGLFSDLGHDRNSTTVVRGDPGTGKTIVGIFLLKLLRDVQESGPEEAYYSDSVFAPFFLPGNAELLRGLKIGLVVPQQSLRDSIRKVFDRTPYLRRDMVLSPFDVGNSSARYDLLIVDETHRLNHRANQSSGAKNQEFGQINKRLFGADDDSLTQLDWIQAQSRHQVFLLDRAQAVRPADLPAATVDELIAAAGPPYELRSQMRVQAGGDYVAYVREILAGDPLATPRSFPGYDLRFYDSVADMRAAVGRRDQEHGLARMVAGYAWPWLSKRDRAAFDIVEDGCKLRWNRVEKDWISSPGSGDEVGSIHTVQGYDLNYAGVLIGRDLVLDPRTGTLAFNRASYFDKKGTENNRRLGIVYNDVDLVRFVRNVYAVLLTRGMRGTYVYVADPLLREHLRPFFLGRR